MACATSGCLATATHWAVWGCLNGHIKGAAYCPSCCDSSREKMLDGKISCHRTFCTLKACDFLWCAMADERARVLSAIGTLVSARW